MTGLSTWLGVLTYSLAIGVAVVWVGISLANWLTNHSWYAVLMGVSAFCWMLFFIGLAIIASDWLPEFSGLYVALTIRVSGFIAVLCLIMFTAMYLRGKRREEGN